MSTHNGAPNPPPGQTEYTLYSELGEHPVFRHTPVTMFSNNIMFTVHNELLARGIPALSWPTGRRTISAISVNENFNMDASFVNGIHCRPNDWGRNDEDYGKQWLHGDLKDMAFFYNFRIFENIVKTGGLK